MLGETDRQAAPEAHLHGDRGPWGAVRAVHVLPVGFQLVFVDLEAHVAEAHCASGLDALNERLHLVRVASAEDREGLKLGAQGDARVGTLFLDDVEQAVQCLTPHRRAGDVAIRNMHGG